MCEVQTFGKSRQKKWPLIYILFATYTSNCFSAITAWHFELSVVIKIMCKKNALRLVGSNSSDTLPNSAEDGEDLDKDEPHHSMGSRPAMSASTTTAILVACEETSL